MDIQIKAKFINYLFKMLSGQYDNLPIQGRLETDNDFISASNGTNINECTPEEVGVPSASVLKLFKNLADNKNIGLHGLLLFRRGKIFAKGFAAPYNEDYRHISHSMCKSVTSMAIGIAVDEGLIQLDEKLVDILPEYVGLLTSKNIKEITIDNLLTMSTGIKFNELSTVFEENWIKGYFDSDTSFVPGKNYEYNSLNTYMLSVVIKVKSGLGLLEYLQPRLFDPLGINDITWETCPKGYEKGGWGMKLNMYDMIKLGQLYLQKGRWLIKGTYREIVSPRWVELSSNKRIDQTADNLATGYGYQIWDLEGGTYIFNGMLGQNVIVVPSRDMVIAMTAGGINLFPDSPGMKIILDFIDNDNNFSENVLPIDRVGNYILNNSVGNMELMEKMKVVKPNLSNLSNVFIKRAFIDEKIYKRTIRKCEELVNKTYYFSEPVGSVMPIMLQAMYNNYSNGVTDISFLYDEEDFAIEFNETHTRNVVKIGFKEPIYQEFILNGYVFRIGVLGKYTTDEDQTVVLKIKIAFVETANTKIIKIFFLDDKIKMQLIEAPSIEAIVDFVIGDDSPMIKSNIPVLNSNEYMKYRLDKFTRPWSYGFEKLN